MVDDADIPLVYLGNLDITVPVDSTIIEPGDDELRIIKKSIQESFPGLTEPFLFGPSILNNLSTKVNTTWTSGASDNNIEFTTKIHVPNLNRQTGPTGEDANYLSIGTNGALGRIPPFSPLGSVFFTPLSQIDMDFAYPGIYTICDGKPLSETSNLFKFLGLLAGSGYKVPDLKTNNRTVRASYPPNRPHLGTIAGMARLQAPDNEYFVTPGGGHDHVEGIAANKHTHTFIGQWTNGFSCNGASSIGAGQAYTHFNQSVGNGWWTYSSYPVNIASETDWYLPEFGHIHSIVWSSDPETRSKEIRQNYFIRIN